MAQLERFRSSHKLGAHRAWVDRYARGESVYPIALEIDPSNRCPLSCPECVWGRYIAGETSELEPPLLLDLVEQAADLGVRSLTWTGGGEPLVNPGTVPAIARASELGLKNGMFTSAVPLTPAVSAAIAPHLTWIRFHLDGADAESYAHHHRVPGAVFDTVVGNVRHFLAARERTGAAVAAGLGTIAYDTNLDQAPALARLAHDLGLDYFQFKLDLLRMQDEAYLAWWDREALPVMKRVSEELASDRFGLQYPDSTRFGPLDRSPRCHVHRLHTAITADGRVSYCKRTRDRNDWSLGSVREQSLREIFDGPRHRALLEQVTPTTCGVVPCPLKEANLVLQSVVDGDASAVPSEPATTDPDFL